MKLIKIDYSLYTFLQILNLFIQPTSRFVNTKWKINPHNSILFTIYKKIDSSFGPLTEGTVRELQTQHKITIDGVVGPNTLKALGSALKAKPEADDEEQKEFIITKELQEFLNKNGFDCGKVDGDPETLIRGAIDKLVDYLY